MTDLNILQTLDKDNTSDTVLLIGNYHIDSIYNALRSTGAFTDLRVFNAVYDKNQCLQ